MADNFSANFGFNARHRNSRDESPSGSGICNEDKVKLNPWKPISATENNALEADAWPEPSAGETRRMVNSKTNEEKPKRSGNYRPRGVDYHRGRGTFYHRNTNKVFPFRLGGEVRYDKSMTSESTINQLSETNTMIGEMKSLSIDSSVSENAVAPIAANPTTSNEADDAHRNSVPNVLTSKRSYRDRHSVAVQNSSQGQSTFAYEAGAVGRARRSYLRQQPSFQSDQDITVQQPLISMPLLPFQGIPPITYYIPGVGGALLGPAGIPVAPGLSSNISITSEISDAYASEPVSIQHPTSTNSVSTADITSDQVESAINVPIAKPLSTLGTQITNEIQTVVVDVVQMVTYINEIGWENVLFPNSLRDHPPVAAAVRSLVNNVDSIDALLQSNKEPYTVISSDESGAKPALKREDVVIVENKVFFVPRNVNYSKFLKFFSKSDYIRHHIEYYFSDLNLQRDMHLQLIMSKNNDVCPISDLLQFNRLRWANTTETELLDAVEQSSHLTITYSIEGTPFAVARIYTPCLETTTAVPVTSRVPDIIASTSDSCTISDKLTKSVACPAATSSSSTVQTDSPVIPPTISSMAGAGGLQSSGQQSFVQPQSYFPMPRADTMDTSVLMNIPYAAGTNNHLGHLPGNVPGVYPVPTQYYGNQLDVSVIPQPNTAPHMVSTNHSGNVFPGTRSTGPSAYSGSGQPTYLAVSPSVAALQAAADPNAASIMTALYRVGAAGVPGNMGGAFVPSLGNTGNAIAPGYAGQQNNGSTFLLQLVPGATHPGMTGYYSNGSQTTGVPGSAFLNRGIQNTVNSPNVWVPLGAAISQNIGSANSAAQANYHHPIAALQQNNMAASGMPLTTTAPVSTPSAAALYPTILPQVNAFALVPNPTIEGNFNVGVVGAGNSTGSLHGGTSESGHQQRPIHTSNGVYLFNNHSISTIGSARSSTLSHSMSEGGTGHNNSKKPSVGGAENAGTGHTSHS